MSLKQEHGRALGAAAPPSSAAAGAVFSSPIFVRLRPALPWLLALALAPAAFATQLYDDAYIHARIAANLLEHGYPAFNPGDHFKASSSTGYVLVIALASLLLEPALAIRLIQAAVITVTIAAFASLAASLKVSRARLALAGAAALPTFLIAAYGGMESSILCLLWALAASADARGNERGAVLFASLAVWFRFEAVLLLALLLYARLRREDLKLLFWALPALILFALEGALYGTIVPHAIAAKSTAYAFPLPLSVAQALGLGERLGLLRFLGMAGSAALLAMLLFPAGRLVRRRGEVGFGDILLVFSGALLCAWMVGRTLIFPWYLCVLFVPAALHLLHASAVPSGSGAWRRALPVALMLILGAFGVAKAIEQIGIAGHPSANARVLLYLKLGSALYAHCPTCTLLSSEIGGLGYAFRGRVHDALGLADPDALRFHPMRVPQERANFSVGAIPPGYAELRDADLIVSMPRFGAAAMGSAFVKRTYQTYHCPFDPKVVTIWGNDGVRVLSKAPLPDATLAAMGCQPRS
jgi:hypothetical protein